MRLMCRMAATFGVAWGVGQAAGQSAFIDAAAPPAGAFWTPIAATVELRDLGVSGLAMLRGSLLVTDNFGLAQGDTQNFQSDFSGPLVNLGTFSGLSRVGINIGVLPPGLPSGVYTIAAYEITPQIAGQIFYVRWVPDPGYEQVQVHLSPVLPAIVPIPTTYSSHITYIGGCCPTPPCPADLTGSAIAGLPGYGIPNYVLSNDDFFFYLDRFAVGDLGRCDLTATAVPGSPGYGFPNGVLSNDDFFYYLAIFSQGC